MWKNVEASKASVLYIYIYRLYITKITDRLFSILISQSNKREFISNVNLIKKKRCQMQ